MVASKIIALCAFLAAGAVATNEGEWNRRVALDMFEKRGDDSGSFKAPEYKKQGSDCGEAFGAGYVTCREKSATEIRLCYNPSMGQTCCSNEWGCPSGSFCLSKNLCCPQGLDAATCAKGYSVPVPSHLKTSDSGPAKTSSTPPPPPPTPYVSAAAAPPPVSTINVIPIPYPAKNQSTVYVCPTGTVTPIGTGTGTITPAPTTSLAQFEGAASSNQLSGAWAGLVVLLAAVQLL